MFAASCLSTVLGNVSTLDTDVPYVQSLMQSLANGASYYDAQPTLVRGTNGSVGTTSFSYGQAFAEVTAVKYLSMNPNTICPKSGCQCMLNTYSPFFAFNPVTEITSSVYTLDQTFYTPLASSVINQDNLKSLDFEFGNIYGWDGEHFMSWLAEDEAFKSAFPHWEDCAVWDTAAGPPGVKLPVAALTGTTSTTVYQEAPVTSSKPQPVSRSSSPLPKSTSFTHTTSSEVPAATNNPGDAGQSVVGTGGDTSESDSNGNGSSGHAVSSATSDASGSSGDVGNNGDTDTTESGGDSGSDSGNDGDTGSTGSGNNQQGSGESGVNTGSTHSTGSSVATGSYNSGQSEASGSNRVSGSSSGGQSSTSDNGSGSQDGGGQGSTGSSSSSNNEAGGESPETNDVTSIAPFVVTVGGHTLSGIVQGNTAAVVAGTTVVAGSSPSSAGGALVSIQPGASSIYVNGESHPLPTAQASYVSAIPIATVGTHILSASPGASAVYYADTTLSQGGAHATIDNTDIYVGASGLVIGSSSVAALPTIDSPQSSVTPIAVIGSQTISAIIGASEVYYAGTTLTQNGAHATIDNTDIYVGDSGLVIGGSSSVALPTLGSPQLSATPIATIGSQTISAVFGASEVYYAGTTLTRNGAHATIDNTDVYVGVSDLVIGGSSSVALPTLGSPQLSATPIATIGGQTISAKAGEIYYAGKTLSQDGAHATIADTDIYVGASGLVIGGSSLVPFLTMNSNHLTATPIATIGSQTISAIPGDSMVYYAGTTLTQNGAHATIDNTDVYVGSSGLVIGGSSTVAIPRLSPSSVTASSPEAAELQTITLGGQTLSADKTAVYVGKSTLAVGGPAVTVSGTPISLGSSDIVIGSTTYTIPSSALPPGTLPAATQTGEGLGSIILGAFGPQTSAASATGTSTASANTSSAVAFQGTAASLDLWESLAVMELLLAGGLFLLVNGHSLA
ncbi:MAG: hypothetical protein Q9195_008152 [Heterodermia aff. obscurata]